MTALDPIRPGIVSALVGPTRDFSGLGYRFHCALIKAGVQGVPRIQAYADTDGTPPTFTDHGAGVGCACVERDQGKAGWAGLGWAWRGQAGQGRRGEEKNNPGAVNTGAATEIKSKKEHTND